MAYSDQDDGGDSPAVVSCTCGGYVVLEGDGASGHTQDCPRR